MPDIPTIEPQTLRAGDTWRWLRTLEDYPAGTWTLKYRFKNAAGGFEIVTMASGTDHDITVAAATSAAYTAGTYQWVAWVESGSEKYTVGQGSTVLLADLRAGNASTALDVRSHARKVLDAIEAVIEGRASLDQESYEIAGRSLKRTPVADLLKLRSRYQMEVRAEDAQEKMAKGLDPGGRILFRL